MLNFFIKVIRSELLNDSLDSLVDNLLCNLYNRMCKHCTKWKGDGVKYVKLVKKLSDYYKDCNKIYAHCKYYLEKIEVRKNTLF